MGKYAHFENVEPRNLYDLYDRHAEVAREIHEDALRDFILKRFPDKPELAEDPDLKVDLVRVNVLGADLAALEKMSEYDSVSVSSALVRGAAIKNYGLYNIDKVNAAREYFEQNDTPIYTVAAGNEGSSGQRRQPRLADFSRNSLVVGEANVSKDGAYIEEHSSTTNPTLASDSPFNHGKRYQYIDPSPSLEGREEFIRGWLVDKKAEATFDAYKDNLPEELVGKTEDEIKDHIYNELGTSDYANSRDVNNQIEVFKANPQSLHGLVMVELQEMYKENDLDDKGFLTGKDGTSYSAPALAGGCISGALYNQEVREEQGLPILTKDEIVTLAKMATTDTRERENNSRMMLRTNEAGNSFTKAGGHGVFNPEMFGDMLDEAYKKIGTDPDIDREPVEIRTNASIEPHDGYDMCTMKPRFPDRPNVMIDRARYEIEMDVPNRRSRVPSEIILDKGEEHPKARMDLQMASGEKPSLAFWLEPERQYSLWTRSEKQFGEILNSDDETWKVKIRRDNETVSTGARATIYGYYKGGLMDKMMDHSQKIAPDYKPKPVEQAPNVNPESETEVAAQSDTAEEDFVANNSVGAPAL